ncbi:XRE family transcriptional regulator [Photorhabdus sp. RM71S]|uniref:XRE family transcriptional regulator n=1 Tax=Photorhabdus sp. RM71S TaxID=3342824 RepID=UPI0036DB9261
MKIRVPLMNMFKVWIAKREFTQDETARVLRITQSRISVLASGKMQLFNVDKLIAVMVHAGVYIRNIEISEPEVA